MEAALVRWASWGRLPDWIRTEASQGGWVYPLYGRLAMGSSHSVFILMAINLFQVGCVLTNRFNRSSAVSADDDRIAHVRATFGTSALDVDTHQANTQKDDADWLKRHNANFTWFKQ